MANLYSVRMNRGWETVYVVADTMNEAARKAWDWWDAENAVKAAKSILSGDGSLNLGSEEEPNYVKSVDLLTKNLIT